MSILILKVCNIIEKYKVSSSIWKVFLPLESQSITDGSELLISALLENKNIYWLSIMNKTSLHWVPRCGWVTDVRQRTVSLPTSGIIYIQKIKNQSSRVSDKSYLNSSVWTCKIRKLKSLPLNLLYHNLANLCCLSNGATKSDSHDISRQDSTCPVLPLGDLQKWKWLNGGFPEKTFHPSLVFKSPVTIKVWEIK